MVTTVCIPICNDAGYLEQATSFSIAPLRYIAFFGILICLYRKLMLKSVIAGGASSVIPVHLRPRPVGEKET